MVTDEETMADVISGLLCDMSDKVISVLFIEDVVSEQNSIIHTISQSDLSSELTIKTASSLTSGLEILRNNHIDVVLLDLDLPDSKGLKLVSTILHEFPDIAIVVISGHSEEGIITEALMMGAEEFIIKGESSGIMIKHTIQQALIRHRIHQKEKMEALALA